jgi:hypothetical protein
VVEAPPPPELELEPEPSVLTHEVEACMERVLAKRPPIRVPKCNDDKAAPTACPRETCFECKDTVSQLRPRPAQLFFACWKRNGRVCNETIEQVKQQACVREAVKGVCGITERARNVCARKSCECAPAAGFDMDVCEKFVSSVSLEMSDSYVQDHHFLSCRPKDMYESIGPAFE